MRFKNSKSWRHFPAWLDDETVITLVGSLLYGGKWKKLTLYFAWETGKEHMVFEGFDFKYDFLDDAGDVELEDLNHIVLEKEGGSEVTFSRTEGYGWRIFA